jgi:hypothetical protein
MKRLLHTLWLLGFPAALQAQEVPEAPADGTARRYAVELIIFEYRQVDSPGTEVFLPELIDPELTGDAGSGPEFGEVPTPAPQAADALPEASEYRLLSDDELALRDTRRMLSRLEAYEPLMHFGWVQEAVPDAESAPLPLQRFGTPPEGLEGTVFLNLSRFLHLGIDLSLAADESRAPAPAIPELGDGRSDGRPANHAAAPRYAPLRYEIEETRIMKSGETRYYDHPHFGVIARVTRIDEAEGPAGVPQDESP